MLGQPDTVPVLGKKCLQCLIIIISIKVGASSNTYILATAAFLALFGGRDGGRRVCSACVCSVFSLFRQTEGGKPRIFNPEMFVEPVGGPSLPGLPYRVVVKGKRAERIFPMCSLLYWLLICIGTPSPPFHWAQENLHTSP